MAALTSTAPDPATERFCPECGYNLRGIASERCPECGLALAGVTSSTVPWEHRAVIGRVRGFCRTVWMATVHPARLARAAHDLTGRRDAGRFRWLVTLVACAAPLTFFGWLVHQNKGLAFLNQTTVNPFVPLSIDWIWELTLTWSAGATLLPVIPIGIVAMVYLWTGLARPWARVAGLTPSQRERARAMLSYSSGPLAWIALAALLLVCAWAVEGQSKHSVLGQAWLIFVIGAVVTQVLAVLGAWWSALRILARTTHCGPARLAGLLVGLPIAWALAATITLVVGPCLVGLVRIAIDSLR